MQFYLNVHLQIIILLHNHLHVFVWLKKVFRLRMKRNCTIFFNLLKDGNTEATFVTARLI